LATGSRREAEIGGKELIKVRRILLTLVLGAFLAMLLASGVALAAEITCTTLWCKGTAGPDTLIGAPTTGDRLEGLDGKDKLYGLGATDALYGGAANDEIHGDVAPDTRDAGAANWDALFGGNGADTLYAEDPATCDEAAACVDVLYAGDDAKPDDLRGGSGADVYVVDRDAYNNGNGVDVIHESHDLGVGEDLPSDDTPDNLHQIAVNGGPHLYFYR
jgi:hypothetical protein